MFNEYEETIETNEQTTLTNWNALTFEEIKDDIDEDVEKWIPEIDDFKIGRDYKNYEVLVANG